MKEYLEEMDLIDIQNAVAISGWEKEVDRWIWERKYNLGDILEK